MKASALPQLVAAKLLDLGERVDALTTEADRADAALTNARTIVNFQRDDVSKAEHEKVRSEFDSIYGNANAARQRADTAQAVLRACREWISNLPANTKLTLVHPVADAAELPALQTQLQTLRAELQTIDRTVTVGDDAASKVQSYVSQLAQSASPLLRGVGQGERLDIRWDPTPLSLAALLHPDQLADYILNTIRAAHPHSHAEVQKRRAALNEQIDTLSYSVACLLCKTGELPDALMAPQHILGVRLQEPEAKVIAV